MVDRRAVDNQLVTNLRDIPVNLTGFPLAGNLMGKPADSFSDWFDNHTRAYLNHENPTGGKHLYNQDMSIFQEEFFDALTDTEMSDIVQVWDEQYGNAAGWLLDKFESEITDAQYFQMQITKTHRDPWPIATMKTQPEVISFEIATLTGTSTFTQQAVVIDRYFTLYSEKRMVANALMAALYGNLSAFDTHLAVLTFHRVNSYFSSPDRLYAFGHVPRTIIDLAAADQRTFGRINKSEFGFTDIKAYAGQVFNQVGYTLDEFFVSRSDAYFMSMFNDINVSFSKTGQGAIANRETITLPGSIAGVRVSALPYIETTVHNNTDEQLMCNPVACGTLAQFRDRTRENPSSQFRSYMRDIEYCGWDTNDWARYEFIRFLESCPSFASDTTKNVTEGYWDTDLLKRLVTNIHGELSGGKVSSKSVYMRTGTRLVGNEHEADPLLRFIPYSTLEANNLPKPTGQRYGSLYPIVLVGQMPELASARSQYLVQIYEQVHERLTTGMSAAEKLEIEGVIEGGGGGASADAKKTGLYKLRQNIRNLTHAHPIFGNGIFTYSKGFVANPVGKDIDAFGAHVKKFIDEYTGINIADEIKASADEFNTASGKKNALKDALEASDTPEESKKVLRILIEFPAYVAEYGTSSKMSALADRLDKARNMPAMMRLAIYLVLLQPGCLQVYRKWHARNVNLPHGGKNLRFRERQMMHSLIATASQGGKLGVRKHTGRQPFTTYQGEIKDFKIQVESSGCFMIPDNKKFFWIPYVRGGPIINGCGGKGSGYFDQRQRIDNPMLEGSKIQQEMDHGKSNFAVLGSLNEAIECKESAVLSVRGFWTRGEFPTRLHDSVDFSRDRAKVMYSGQMMFNLINEFTYDPSDDVYDVENLNQLEIVSRRMVNYACHQGSIKMWTPADPEFITRSEHNWGPQLPGLRDLEQSLTRVRQEKPSEAAEIRKRLKREL
jgi:hypothetical protein